MKCTSCNQGTLIPTFIDSLFRAHQCNHCQGHWILIEDFLSWKEKHPDHELNPNVDYEEDNSDTTRALLCPATGNIMTKFKLSANSNHRLDYSQSVGGIWLDKGEWDLLKEAGIALSLNKIVTAAWQTNIRNNAARNSFAELYLAKFGEDAYEQAKALRKWLNNHPQKADLRAYILAEDPYSAEK